MSYFITQTFTSILLFILFALEPRTTCTQPSMVYNYFFFGMLITTIVAINFCFTHLFTLPILFYTLHAAWILGSVLNMFVDIVMLLPNFTDTECSIVIVPFIRVHQFTYIIGSACVLCSSYIVRFSSTQESMEGSDNERRTTDDNVAVLDLIIM